jgi:hypothetical protein
MQKCILMEAERLVKGKVRPAHTDRARDHVRDLPATRPGSEKPPGGFPRGRL